MASRLTMAVVLISGLALATRAQAGVVLNNPVPANACATMAVVGQMGNPNVFSLAGGGITAKQCDLACRMATVECKQTVKLNFACAANVITRDLGFHSEACVVGNAGNASGTKSCILNQRATAATDRLTLRSDRLTDLAGCDSYGASCLTACAGL